MVSRPRPRTTGRPRRRGRLSRRGRRCSREPRTRRSRGACGRSRGRGARRRRRRTSRAARGRADGRRSIGRSAGQRPRGLAYGSRWHARCGSGIGEGANAGRVPVRVPRASSSCGPSGATRVSARRLATVLAGDASIRRCARHRRGSIAASAPPSRTIAARALPLDLAPESRPDGPALGVGRRAPGQVSERGDAPRRERAPGLRRRRSRLAHEVRMLARRARDGRVDRVIAASGRARRRLVHPA